MWDTIVEAMKTGNGWLIILLFIMVALTARFGHLKIKTDKILIGKVGSEQIRLTMIKQLEYAHYKCMAFEKGIPRFDGYDEKLGKLIAEKAYDEVTSWIVANHITTEPYYIGNKQDIIWSLIVNETVDKRLRSEKFRKESDRHVKELIEQLVVIRDGDGKE